MQRFLTLCLIIASALGSLGAETFPNPQHIPTGQDPFGVHAVDLNNDGLPDLYYFSVSTTNPVHVSLHVLLGGSGSTYVALNPIVLPANTYSTCTPVDVNGDGKIDLVCPNSLALQGSVLTLLGNGDGTFQPPVSTPFPGSHGNYYDLEILGQGDLNLDGHADLIVYDALNEIDYILLGDGAGHFAVSSTNIAAAGSVTVADVNNDGNPDLLFNNGPGVALGKGDGTFSSFKLYGGETFSCVFVDIDGDRHLDAVCGAYVDSGSAISAGALVAMHGNSDGSFNPLVVLRQYSNGSSSNYSYAQLPQPLAVQDVNGDGILDVIASTNDGTAVILGQANLKFADSVYYFSGNGYPPIVADMNKDGNLDLVAVGPNSILITYGRPGGTFDSPPGLLSGDLIRHTAVADFNGDGTPDIATAGDPAINLRLGNPDGTFSPSTALPQAAVDFSSAIFLFHGDFNGDGKQDLLSFGQTSAFQSNSYLLFGHGDGTFDAPVPAASSNFFPSSFSIVVDLNQDGRDDVINFDSQNLHVFPAQPDGTFVYPSVDSPIPQEQSPQNSPSVAFGDFNNDGVPDAVVGLKNLYLLAGKGDGSFSTATQPNVIPGLAGSFSIFVAAVATGDFDGDDNLDVAVITQSTSGISSLFIYYGNGDGTFSPATPAGVFNRTFSTISTTDLDNDGRSDLVLTGSGPGDGNLFPDGVSAVEVVHGLINRTVDAGTLYSAGVGLSFAALVDVNRDGFPDLLFTNSASSNSFGVLTNIPGPVVGHQLAVLPEPSSLGQPFTLTATLAPPPGSPEQQIAGPITFSIDRVQVGTANLANGTASLPMTTSLSLGTHRITASWPGDSVYASLVFHATHTVVKIPVTTTLNAQPNPATVGQKLSLTFSFANSVSSPTLPPTGTYTLLDGANTISSGAVTTDSATYNFTGFLLSTGTHIFTVNYSGDANHASSTTSSNVVVNPASSTVSLQSTPDPVPYGQPITFTGQVAANINPSTPALLPAAPGTITISGIPANVPALPVTFSSSSPANTPVAFNATTTTNVAPGTYSVTATFSGDTNLLASTSTVVRQIVSPPPSVTTLSFSPSAAYQAHPATLTAKVVGVISTPTGSIQFLDGTTVLATVPLTAGVATFTTAGLSVGTHTLSASYSGDTNNAASVSSPVSQQILSYDFSLTASPPSVSVATGSSTTVTLTATSIGNFAEGTNLSIGSIPPNATVTLSLPSLALTVGGTATTTLTINAGPTQTAASHAASPHRTPRLKAAFAFMLAPALFSLFRRRRLSTLLVLTLACAFFAGTLGCATQSANPNTPPGSYTLQITGTSAQTQQVHTLSIPLIVTR